MKSALFSPVATAEVNKFAGILSATLSQHHPLGFRIAQLELSLLMKMKEKSVKVGLKFNIQKTKIMASDPITLWQIDGETGETVTDLISLGLQSHCRY